MMRCSTNTRVLLVMLPHCESQFICRIFRDERWPSNHILEMFKEDMGSWCAMKFPYLFSLVSCKFWTRFLYRIGSIAFQKGKKISVIVTASLVGMWSYCSIQEPELMKPKFWASPAPTGLAVRERKKKELK